MSPASALPEGDLARIRLFCEEKSPPEHADRVRVEPTVRGQTVTIVEHELFEEDWLDLMVARLKYDTATGHWTLYWPDRNSRFQRYVDLKPGPVASLLAEIASDPFGIFWG
jgi:hypothetical protein